MSQCPRGATGPTKWRRAELCTASGGVEADEISATNHTMATRNWRVSFEWELLHVMPHNHTRGISETLPISKACHACIDSNTSARSSEREQRILAASRSAKRALLHREREGEFELQSTYADSRTLSDWSVCDLNRRFKTSHTNFCFKRCSGSA